MDVVVAKLQGKAYIHDMVVKLSKRCRGKYPMCKQPATPTGGR